MVKKKGNYIMAKGSIHPKDITTVNFYVPNTEGPTYIKQTMIDELK